MKIKGLEIEIGSWDFVDLLTDEEKSGLATALSCDNKIIQNVVDQLIHGCTKDGSHGSTGSSYQPSTPLDKAKNEIAKNCSKVSKKEIEALERELKYAKESSQKGWDKYHELANKFGY